MNHDLLRLLCAGHRVEDIAMQMGASGMAVLRAKQALRDTILGVDSPLSDIALGVEAERRGFLKGVVIGEPI